MTITVGEIKTYLSDRASGKSGKLLNAGHERAILHGMRMLSGYCDWSFFRKSKQLVTTAEYSTGYVDLTHSSQAVVGSGTTFVSGHVNQLLIPSTQMRAYKISAYNSATSLTLEAPFIADDAQDDDGINYRIVFRDVTLPSDFRDMEEVYMVSDRDHDRLLAARVDKMEEEWSLRPSSGTPAHYSIYRSLDVAGGTDDYLLRLYPASEQAKALTIVYMRWPTEPDVTDDAGKMDWPDKYRDALYAACFLALTEDVGSDLRSVAQSEFRRIVERTKSDDMKHSGPLYLGGDKREYRGNPIIVRSDRN